MDGGGNDLSPIQPTVSLFLSSIFQNSVKYSDSPYLTLNMIKGSFRNQHFLVFHLSSPTVKFVSLSLFSHSPA